MIYNMTTSKSIIAKVIADLDLEEDKIKITDIKQWIGEAMLQIGSIKQQIKKVAILELKDYQCKLPCNLISIDLVAYSTNKTNWLIINKTTGAFSVPIKHSYKVLYDCGELKQNNIADKVSDRFTNKVYNDRINTKIEYDLKPGYLFSNKKEGYIKLAYYSEQVDEEGMPLIPDIISYSEAIYWYVVMKLLYIEYFTGRKPQNLYYDAKRSWNFYRNQAYAESLLPSESNEIDNMKNTWHTLMPEIDRIDDFFYNMNDESTFYNH